MRNWKRRLQRAATDLLSLPPDALLDVSRLTCVDGAEIVVENAVSLLHVSQTAVEVDLGKMRLELVGQDFIVTLVSGREIHVQGAVERIVYHRNPQEGRR